MQTVQRPITCHVVLQASTWDQTSRQFLPCSQPRSLSTRSPSVQSWPALVGYRPPRGRPRWPGPRRIIPILRGMVYPTPVSTQAISLCCVHMSMCMKILFYRGGMHTPPHYLSLFSVPGGAYRCTANLLEVPRTKLHTPVIQYYYSPRLRPMVLRSP